MQRRESNGEHDDDHRSRASSSSSDCDGEYNPPAVTEDDLKLARAALASLPPDH